MSTTYEVCLQIAAQIQIAAPLAVVWPFDVLGGDTTTWPAYMRSPNDANRVHGWCVIRRFFETTQETGGHSSHKDTFWLWGVHYLALSPMSETNSDVLFNAELDALRAQFSLRDVSAPAIQNHYELQGRTIGKINTGAELVHWAYTELVVDIC